MPQVLGATAFTVGGTAVTYGAIIQTILAVGSIAAARQQSQKQKRALKRLSDLNAEAQDRSFTAKQPAGPRRIVYGECRVGGNIVFIHTNGTNNQYLHLFVAMAGHEVEGFSNLQFNDEVVPINSSGEATGRFAGHVIAQYSLGSPSQTSNAALLSNCPEVWTSDHRLRGIAGVYVRLKYNADLFPNGIPNITAVCKGKKVYDPRTGLTSWSNNAALCLADYLCDDKLGMGLDYESEIEESELIASANVCGELIELEDETFEKRYTVNGAITTDTVHQDVIDDLVGAMAGQCTYISGRWSIIAGYYRSPSLTFDESSLRGPISMQTKVSRSANFNAVKGTFISPQNFWQPSDFPIVTNSTYETEDGNVRIFRDMQFPFTTSSATCQRLAKIALEKVRQPITLQIRGNLSWLRVQCGDVINFSNTRFGFSAKPFEVVELEIVIDVEAGIGVDATLRETASTVFDWNDGEETAVDPAPNTTLPDPFLIQPPTNLEVLSDNTTRIEVLSGDFVPRIEVTWTAPADEYVRSAGTIRMQYKRSSETTWVDAVPMPGNQQIAYIQNPIEAESYVVRIRSENRLGIVSPWIYSDPTAASGDTTEPADPTSFTATGGIGGVFLEWTNPADSDFDYTEIYEHTAATPAPSGGSTAFTSVAGPTDTYFRSGLPGGNVRYYWIRAVDTSGNRSDWVGPQGATVAAEMTATLNKEYLYQDFPNVPPFSLYTIDEPISVIVTGGVSSYSYAWQYVSGATTGTAGSPTSATTTFSLTDPEGGTPGGLGSFNSYWRCQVTDSSGSVAYTETFSISATMSYLADEG